MAKELLNLASITGRLRSTPLLALFIIIEVFVFFFVPKLNLLGLPGFTIQAKPEDLVWLLMLPLILLHRPHVNSRAAFAFSLLLGYLVVSVFWFPSNAALVLRLFLYAFPLLYAVLLRAKDTSKLVGMTRFFLYSMAVISCLQVMGPFPYFHTGELLIGPVDRASGIYGNGVEFALMALLAFWMHHFLVGSTLGPWLAGLVITVFSGTRLASLALLASGFVFIRHWSWYRIVFLGVFCCVILAAALILISSDGGSRFSEIDPAGAVAAIQQVFSSLQASGISGGNTEGYCFDFDNSLADDQSLAMRLSKLLFVVENVVLGSNKLGFGLGRCIGDAGDNLYVRVLSDGGIPYLGFLMFFWGALVAVRIEDRAVRTDWRVFLVILFSVSFFYDTLYFSRVAPFVFIIASVVINAPVGIRLIWHRVANATFVSDCSRPSDAVT